MYKKFNNEYIEKVNDLNKEKNKTYAIYTMGCAMNENDSQKYSGMLESMGYSKTNNIEDADFVLFNTCCVRENAEKSVFGKLGELKNIKKNKEIILCFAGCMSQQEHIVKKIEKTYKFVDIVIGTHNSYTLPEKIYNVLVNKEVIREVWNTDGEIIEDIPILREEKYRASITIMYGCNNFCTYCIVPYVRGRERSRKPEEIYEEVQNLAKKGYKEITLLGQNVNSYGNDLEEKIDFADLIKNIAKVDGIECIRFVSPHPKDFSDKLINVISENKNIARSIHVPLQSGSTKILKSMNRKYTKEDYLKLINKIKNKIPDSAFSTDIIVGFPGETEEDFNDTLDVIKQVEYEQIYMFIYSKRIGTKAAEMEDQIPYEIKQKRLEIIKNIHKNSLEEINQNYLGKEYEVLVEGVSKNNSETLTGRNSQNKVIVFDGDKELIGKMIKVKITSQHLWYLKGERVNKDI